MALQTTTPEKTRKVNSSLQNSKYANVSRPLPIKGVVNIDNISDREFEIVEEIAESTFAREINWRPQGFLSILSSILIQNKVPELEYIADYKGHRLSLRTNAKGKTALTVTKKFSGKKVLETFIPFNPVVRFGVRTGTSRAMLLNRLMKTVRFQVEGELLAS
jgi:hypothetical protein